MSRPATRLWKAYDKAGSLALDLAAGRTTIVVEGGSVKGNSAATDDLVALLDQLRAVVRERIETDAVAGKDVRR